ncbi:MAG: DUF2306 domain-containing protein [Paracoccaceae bacterium]
MNFTNLAGRVFSRGIVFASRTLYWLLSFILVIMAFRWLPDGLEKTIPWVAYQLQDNAVALYVHMISAAIPMAIIPFQLWGRFHRARPRLHRYLGSIAVISTMISGMSLIPLALNIDAPAWGQAGFIIGGVLWMSAAAIAVYYVWRRDYERHRWWMMITATLIFGAVTLRFTFPVFRDVGLFSFEVAYSLAGWSSWTFNLTGFFAWQYRRQIRALFVRRDRVRNPSQMPGE